jgi:glycosyltransferase involved in cell wall biosynthesis
MAAVPSFSVIIPMFNEESGAEACVRAVSEELRRLPNRTSLIVVEDGSSDHTKEILERLASAEPKLILAVHTHNQGYGAALCTGNALSVELGFDYALFMDSDLTNAPADLPRFAEEMKKGMEVIKASRFIRGGGMIGVPWQRAVVSRFGNWVASILFRVGVRDCTNGFRAVKTSLLRRMRLSEPGFPIIMEEFYQSTLLAREYSEVPVRLTNRGDNLRPTSFTYDISTLRKYLWYAIKAFVRFPRT